MVKVKIYAIFYASDVRLEAHDLGGLQSSCGMYVAGVLTTWNQKEQAHWL